MIDVSSNNHPMNALVNWAMVRKAGYRAVMVKSSEGLNYRNPWRQPDAVGAHAAGLHIGFYHFARPAVGNAAAEADYAIAAIEGLPRDIGLALDLEVTGGLTWSELATWAKNFLARVAQHDIGSPIYSDPAFMEQMPELPFGHKLWLADWGVTPGPEVTLTYPGGSKQMHRVWAWQTGAARVPGVPSAVCDVGVFYG